MDKPTGKKPESAWHAIAIVPTLESCDAAQALREQRFLSKDAPALPLPDCTDRNACRCGYRHFTGRRVGARRSSEDSGIEGRPPAVDQRKKRGRRKSDCKDD